MGKGLFRPARNVQCNYLIQKLKHRKELKLGMAGRSGDAEREWLGAEDSSFVEQVKKKLSRCGRIQGNEVSLKAQNFNTRTGLCGQCLSSGDCGWQTQAIC